MISEPVGDDVVDPDAAGRKRVAAQWARMPRAWRVVDRGIVQTTQGALFVAGVLFAAMITLEVISRYVFSFSISFVNAAARLLLVWFFLLGAGIAMRHGAHVGFELLVSALSVRARRIVVVAGLVLTMVFSAEMVWAGYRALGPALAQTEPGLDISLMWPILALPVGFALLLYHTAVVAWMAGQAPVEGPA
jgi:TRAP-type C4-dicarboxylate transport system permease small subunit